MYDTNTVSSLTRFQYRFLSKKYLLFRFLYKKIVGKLSEIDTGQCENQYKILMNAVMLASFLTEKYWYH